MPEIGTSGLMSGERKRDVAAWPKSPRLSSTLLAPSGLRHGLLRVNLRVHIPQNILLHLAHGVARQFVDHEHALGHLEFGEPAVERLQHARFGDLGALAAD